MRVGALFVRHVYGKKGNLFAVAPAFLTAFIENIFFKTSREPTWSSIINDCVCGPEYNFLLSTDRLSVRNDTTLEKVNFRTDNIQNLVFEENQDVKGLCSA